MTSARRNNVLYISVQILLQGDHFMPAEDEKGLSVQMRFCFFTVRCISQMYHNLIMYSLTYLLTELSPS
jgi:hypothetical protein